MPRKRDAWGSVTYDKNRRVGYIRYWASLDERGYMRHTETVHGSRKDVERRRSELMLDHSEDAPCPTMGQVYERWYLPDRERMLASGDLRPHTMEQDRSLWKRHVKPRWGDVPCDRIRPLEVQQWITKSLTGSIATRALSQGRRILEYAQRYEFIASNPMDMRYVMPSKSTIAKKDDYAWTLQELGELWKDHCLGRWWEGAFICSAFGSARVGESLAPKADDVWHTERNGVFVAVVPIRAQVSNTTKRIETELKNGWSPRDIVIPGLAGERLVRVAEENRGTYLTDDGLGGHVQQYRLWEAWKRELGGECHPFRNLRKSWQTFTRWHLRIPAEMTERMMGHVGAGVTAHHYDRPEVEDFIDAITLAYAERPYACSWEWLRDK